MAVFRKDNDATLDYKVDYSTYLEATDTIVSARASAVPGLTVVTASITDTSTSHTIWLTGGSIGSEYNVTSRIYTSAGRIDERSFVIRVEER